MAEHTTFVFLGNEILFGPFEDWCTKRELFGCRENLVGSESVVMVNKRENFGCRVRQSVCWV